jgi:hypothetical protein
MTTVPAPRRIEYLPLGELRPDPVNPKAHDLPTLDASVGRFGFVESITVDGRTGYVVSGHGRRDVLAAMRDRGEQPPEGVLAGPDGDWLVPVETGWSSRTDSEAHAYLIAANRTTVLGGWDDSALLGLLEDLAADDALDGIGYKAEDIDGLRELLDANVPDGLLDEPEKYLRTVDVPHYQITGAKPEVSALVDRTRATYLEERIAGADLPEDVRAFLLAAAQRHNRFDYAQIAEFYAHADPDLQLLMEESALVIIDFNDAIRYGYVKLQDRLTQLLGLALEQEESADA